MGHWSDIHSYLTLKSRREITWTSGGTESPSPSLISTTETQGRLHPQGMYPDDRYRIQSLSLTRRGLSSVDEKLLFTDVDCLPPDFKQNDVRQNDVN